MRRSPSCACARQGTALILALILLTALLLLGLPFLFTQSASVAGSHAYAQSRERVSARESAEHLAAALAGEAMRQSFAAQPSGGGTDWTSLGQLTSVQIPGTGGSLIPVAQPLVAVPEQGDGTMALSAGYLQSIGLAAAAGTRAGGARATVGAIISDESGRLDPNTLSAPAWSRLLTALGIADWTDAAVYPAPGPMPVGGYLPGVEVPSSDGLGQLAKSLATVRMLLPSGRITDLAQPLEATPQLPPPTSGASGGPCTGPFPKVRWPLTRAELARLTPFLSLQPGLPGRAGLDDLGTVLAVEAGGTVWLDAVRDPQEPLVGIGSSVVSIPPTSARTALAIGATQQAGAATTGLPRLLGTVLTPLIPPAPSAGGSGGGAWCGPRDTLWVEQAASVNLHQLAPVARAVLGPPSQPLPIPANGGIVSTLGGLWSVPAHASAGTPIAVANLAPWLAPLSSGAELPIVGLASSGVMRIDSAAADLDPLGQLLGVVHQDRIVQCVPQELLLEKRWLTQGDDEALIRARWTSRMASWPRAVARDQQQAPDDHDLATGQETHASNPTLPGLRPRAQPDEAMAAQAGTASTSASMLTWPLEQEPIDWRVGFGALTPETVATLGTAETLGLTGPGMSALPLGAAALPPPSQCMRPDGFSHAPGTQLAYALAPVIANGQLSQSALFLPRPGSQELGARQFGLWVRPEQDWTTGLHPLVSVRMPAALTGVRLDGSAGNPACENWLQLTVDATRGLLVLAIAPPTVEQVGDAGPGIDAVDPADPLLDHASLADQPTAALSPDCLRRPR